MPEYCSCSQPLLRQTLGPSPSTVHLCQRWKHTTILKMVVIWFICIIRIIRIIRHTCIKRIKCIKCIIRYIRIMYIILIISFRQDGWSRLDPRLYTSLTTENQSCMSSMLSISCENFLLCQWGHRHDSAPSAQSIFSRTWRPQAGCWRWMQDVVRQFVSNGVVPWHVMNGRCRSESACVSHLAPFW